jgi:uncharacterized membrane protein (DUF2068 family)
LDWIGYSRLENQPASFNVSIGASVRFGLAWQEGNIDSAFKRTTSKRPHNQWLIMIAAFKLAQALLFIAVGVGALRLVHKDLGDVLLRLAHHLRFGPESRFVDFLLDHVSVVNDKLLRRIGFGLFAYAALGLTEGIGLYLEKTWAEYFTLGITASFLPWEIFEIFRHVTVIRSALLAVNVLVFFYLLKVVTERGKQERSKAKS